MQLIAFDLFLFAVNLDITAISILLIYILHTCQPEPRKNRDGKLYLAGYFDI